MTDSPAGRRGAGSRRTRAWPPGPRRTRPDHRPRAGAAGSGTATTAAVLERWMDVRGERAAVWLVRHSRGRIGRPWRRRVLVLTTRGRRTGRLREVVLQAFPDGDDIVVVAANGGLPGHPGWYHNLTADPRATAELDGRRLHVRAEQLGADEAAAFWPRVLAAAPDYARYPRRTDRAIPLLRLVVEPGAAAEHRDRPPAEHRDRALAAEHREGPPAAGAMSPRRGLAVAAGLVAASAYGGGLALARGTDPHVRHLADQLPLRSPALSGLALVGAVAVPYTVLARRAWTGHPGTDASAVVAGSLLTGWIGVETVVLTERSVLQPLYAGIGLVTALAGPRRRGGRRRRG